MWVAAVTYCLLALVGLCHELVFGRLSMKSTSCLSLKIRCIFFSYLTYKQAAMPEESGWYFCVATSGSQVLESGLYVEVVNNRLLPLPPPAPPIAKVETTTTTLGPDTDAAPAADLSSYGDRFRIYKTLEGLAQVEVFYISINPVVNNK